MSNETTPLVVRLVSNRLVVKPQTTRLVVKPNPDVHTVTVKLTSDYTHPQYHPASMIREDEERQFMRPVDRARSAGYRYVQLTASDRWVIEHTLKKKPSVSIVDSSGRLVVGNVEYVTNDIVIVSFKAKFAGEAYLN